MLRPRMTSRGGATLKPKVPLTLTGQNIRHDDKSMIRKAQVVRVEKVKDHTKLELNSF